MFTFSSLDFSHHFPHQIDDASSFRHQTFDSPTTTRGDGDITSLFFLMVVADIKLFLSLLEVLLKWVVLVMCEQETHDIMKKV